ETANGYFTRAGYGIVGWSENADGSTTDYALGASYTANAGDTLYPVWELNSCVVNSGDTYVNSGSGSAAVFGSSSSMIFKNASSSTSNSYNRAGYLRFEYDPSITWDGATLQVTVNSSSQGNANSFYNGTNNFQVKVYAVGTADWDEATLTFNSANASSADWGLNTGTFPWAIDNGTLLGTIDIPTSTSTIGVSYGLSNAALDSFLNADSDGEVTFFLVRSDTQSQPNLGFATKDQTTYSAPTLLPHPASCAYTITYNKGSASGAGGSDNTATKIQGTGLTLPDSTTANNYFTRTGYTVTGWATNADGTGTTYAFGATYTAERNQTLYPVWTPDTYTVTYTYNGATGGNSTTSEQYTVDSTVVALPTPAKTGYTFVGWYAESGLTTLVGTGGASYTPAADATLYAKWSAATFTVVYDYNGATGGNTTTNDDFTTGSGSPITLPTPTRTGYTFGGWYSDAALTSSVGAAGASYSPSVNLTVYAKWTADSRSVTYVGTNKTSGSVPTDGASYIIGNSVVVKANSGGLVRTGYDFAGWTENSDGSGTVLEAGDTVAVQTSDITLYVKWTAATYTITYHANGGSGTLARATDTFTTGNSGVTLPGVGSLTKTGYDFGGWSTTPTGSALVGAYSTSQDRTLYAVWTIKSITYSYAKGSDGDGNSLSSFGFSASFPTGSVDDFGTSVTLSSSVDASIDADANGSVDHQFFGWSDGTTVYDAGDTYVLGETNPTFTAQWIKVFSVRYALAGGSFAGSDSATDSQCIGTDDTCTDGQIISLNSRPSRAGYTFLGWEDQSGTVKSAAAVTTITSSSYLFTAKWDPIDYTLNFNSLGGSNVISDYTQNIGDIVTIPDPGSKTGYSFGGWSDGSTLYGIGGTYTVGASGASFSAQWIPDVYTVTYDWQGGSSSSPDVSDTYTVGTGDMSLATASGSGYSRDGYTFSGWATSVGGSVVSGFRPTADDVLYAVWADGNYTLSYDGQGGTVASGIGTVPRTTSVTLPTPVRSNFTFVGWYDAASGGNLLGAGGASFTPTSSQSLYARWVQDSLYGVDLATLETANTYTASNSTSTDTTISHAPSSSSARVQIPAGALPAGTVVTVRYFKDTERATDLISDENTYFFSLLVSWLYGSGISATVPDTAAGKPITVTLTNSNIKAGAMVYQVIGETVTELARATVDGSVTVELTEDPEVVVAATKPSAPTSVSGTSGDTRVSVSWTAGSSGGSPITGYTVTASPGGATCSTASTSCTINSLTNNTAYTFTVTAQNALGASTASTASSAVTPVGANYAVTFDANGGPSVSAGSFFSGSTVSAPSSPSRSGYTFEGWSTTLDDDTTKVTFPYAPGVTNAITLYALWEEVPAAPSRGNSGRVVTPPVRPSLPITPARPTITVPVVTPPPVLQAPVASPVAPSVLGGSSQAVVGGQSVATETTQRGNSGVGVKAGNVEVGIGVKTPSPNSRVQSNPASGNPELVVAAGEVATINGKGMLPGSTVQFWLPGADSRELGRVTVLPDGSINADVSLANSPAEPPLPIGR
ncbi:MAG: beta strand repeat-containing protein, partial [Pontimonas sp.]